MTQWEWLQLGIREGWCSEIVCNTHEGLPCDDEEEAAWERGEDPCVPAVRLYEVSASSPGDFPRPAR
jgi:hypothetical protein